MIFLGQVMVWFVALLHVGFFVLESVLWTHPRIRAVFGNSESQAQATRVLALNQGGYNLGLALLLIGLQLMGNTPAVLGLLGFIVAMGILGAVTASRAILVLQALPAAAAAVLLWITHS
jgi:putative membrane protein